MRRSAPPSSRCVANAWRRRWGCGIRRRSVEVSSRRPRVERKSAFVGAAGELGPRLAEVAGDPVRGLLAERDDPVLRALAVPDVDVLLLEVDVAEVEPDRLGAAQAGRVDELEQRPVAERRAAPPSPSASARIASTSSAFGASGSRRPRRSRERDVGHGARRRARSGAARAPPRAAARSSRGASFPPGPRAAEVGGVVGEDAHVDLLELAVRRTTRRSRADRTRSRDGSTRRCPPRPGTARSRARASPGRIRARATIACRGRALRDPGGAGRPRRERPAGPDRRRQRARSGRRSSRGRSPRPPTGAARCSSTSSTSTRS